MLGNTININFKHTAKLIKMIPVYEISTNLLTCTDIAKSMSTSKATTCILLLIAFSLYSSRDIRLQHQLCRWRWFDLHNQICEFPLLVLLVFEHLCINLPSSMRSPDMEVYLQKMDSIIKVLEDNKIKMTPWMFLINLHLNALNAIFISPSPVRNSLTSCPVSAFLTITRNRRSNSHSNLMRCHKTRTMWMWMEDATKFQNKMSTETVKLRRKDDLLIRLFPRSLVATALDSFTYLTYLAGVKNILWLIKHFF